MPNEKPVFGHPILIREPRAKKHPRVGVLIHTGPEPQLFNNEKARLPSFGQTELGKKPMSYSAAIDYWKKEYEIAVLESGMDKEIALTMYTNFHHGVATDDADPFVTGLKKKIEEGLVLTERETLFKNPEYFRQRLLSPKLRAEELYKFGLLALRMDRVLPEKRDEFDAVGFSLLEAAANASPRNPKFKLALKLEYERKMEERRIRNQKAETAEPNPKNVEAFNAFNAPQIFEVGTPGYYLKQIKRWEDLIDLIANRVELNYELFNAEYAKMVRDGTINRDIRNYNGNKIMFRPQDFEESLRNEDPNAFIMGLTGLYGIRKNLIRRKVVEPTALKLLAKSAELPPPPKYHHKWPQPWQVFVPYVIVQELYRLLGLTKKVSKPEAKRRQFNDMMFRVLGSEHEELKNIKPLNSGKSTVDDEIPF